MKIIERHYLLYVWLPKLLNYACLINDVFDRRIVNNKPIETNIYGLSIDKDVAAVYLKEDGRTIITYLRESNEIKLVEFTRDSMALKLFIEKEEVVDEIIIDLLMKLLNNFIYKWNHGIIEQYLFACKDNFNKYIHGLSKILKFVENEDSFENTNKEFSKYFQKALTLKQQKMFSEETLNISITYKELFTLINDMKAIIPDNAVRNVFTRHELDRFNHDLEEIVKLKNERDNRIFLNDSYGDMLKEYEEKTNLKTKVSSNSECDDDFDL